MGQQIWERLDDKFGRPSLLVDVVINDMRYSPYPRRELRSVMLRIMPLGHVPILDGS